VKRPWHSKTKTHTKDKDIAQLKNSVRKLKEESALKGEEMKAMKLVNIELRREVENLKKLTEIGQKQLSNKVETQEKSTVQLETKVVEYAVPKVNDSLEALKASVNNRINNAEVEFRSGRSHFDKSMNRKSADIKELSSKVDGIVEKVNNISEQVGNLEDNMANIERVCFFSTSNDIKLKWVVDNYKQRFEKGEVVYSPIFNVGVSGYLCQLKVRWKGNEKEKLGFYLILQRQ